MSTHSLDLYLKTIVQDGFPASFLTRSADRVDSSELDLSADPRSRLYLQYLLSVMEILTSEREDRIGEIVSDMKASLSDAPALESSEQWIGRLTEYTGESSLETVALALGIYAYIGAVDDNELFMDIFVDGWIRFFMDLKK